MLHQDTGFLNARGYLVAVVLMVLFTAINLAGGKFMSESNILIVIWKFVVPLLAVVVVATLQFEPANFTAGGGFMPHGWHGVFAALTGGGLGGAGLRAVRSTRRRGGQPQAGLGQGDPGSDGDGVGPCTLRCRWS